MSMSKSGDTLLSLLTRLNVPELLPVLQVAELELPRLCSALKQAGPSAVKDYLGKAGVLSSSQRRITRELATRSCDATSPVRVGAAGGGTNRGRPLLRPGTGLRSGLNRSVASRLSAANLQRRILRGQQLVLVHIPKTAGTAIENSAQRLGVKWGKVQAEVLRGRLKRSKPEEWDAFCERYEMYSNTSAKIGPCGFSFYQLNKPAPISDGRVPIKRCCSWWHVPPAWQPSDDPRRYYAEAQHRFCVVRDPFARLLSHFLWIRGNKVVGYPKPEQVRSAPERDDCHFVPQAAYLAPGWMDVRTFLRRTPPLANLSVDGAPPPPPPPPSPSSVQLRPGGVPGCNVVIRYENLAEDFPHLMQWAGLEAIKLPKPPATKRENASKTGNCLTRSGVFAMMDDDAKTLVQELYATDFDAFDYPRDGTELRATGAEEIIEAVE